MASKCFIGYGDSMSHVNMKSFKKFKNDGTNPITLLNDFVSRAGSLNYIIRLHKKEGNNNIFYLPNRKKLDASDFLTPCLFSSGCRESIRDMFNKLCRLIKSDSIESAAKDLAIGFKFQHKNKQQINVRMKRAIKLLNVIEDHFGWEDRTELYKSDKKNILFVNEDAGFEDLPSNDDKTVTNSVFKDYVQRTTTFYLFKPAREWILSSHTMSLFMLFMRLCANNRYGNVNNYKDFLNQTEKILAPYKGCVYFVHISNFVNIKTGAPVSPQTKDDVYLFMIYYHFNTFFKNIYSIFDNKINIYNGDNMLGITRFVANTYRGAGEGIGKDIKRFVTNFSNAIEKEIEGAK